MIFKGHLSEYESIAPLDTKRQNKSLFSNVFKARDVSSGETVVLKTIHNRFAKDNEAVERFMREAKYDLHHPNIVNYTDSGTDPACFIINEFIDGKPAGENIAKLFASRRDIIRNAVEIFISLCDALDYIHSKGIIHCDIKPSNILVTRKEPHVVKLIDFGQAHLLNDDPLPHRRFPMVYSPPEILFGRFSMCGPYSDIYSAGISLYELITGSYPFRHCNSLMVINLQLNYPLPKNEKIPANLARVLAKATTKIPLPRPPQKMTKQEIIALLEKGIAQRYQSAKDFRKDLEECL